MMIDSLESRNGMDSRTGGDTDLGQRHSSTSGVRLSYGRTKVAEQHNNGMVYIFFFVRGSSVDLAIKPCCLTGHIR